MNRNRFALLGVIIFLGLGISSCKKDSNSSSSDALLVNYSITGNLGVTTLPCTVKLISYVPEGADQVTWVFPDSSTATGDSVTHTFNSYGNFIVRCEATKGSRVGSLTKGVPVMSYRKVQLRTIDFLQTEPKAPGNYSWDDFGGLPDLAYRITMPDGSVSTTGDQYVLYNADTGSLNTIPTIYSTKLDGTVKIEVLDLDTGATPRYEFMGSVSFYLGDYVLSTQPYPTKVELQKGFTKLEVGLSWIQ